MNVDPKQIASIIDGRAAVIETLDSDILMETVGVAMALDKLRESLDKLADHLDDREFEKASHVGYEDLAHNFVYVQRTLAGLQSVTHQKEALISDIAREANSAYEDVSPYVDERMSSSVPRHQQPAQEIERGFAVTGLAERSHFSLNPEQWEAFMAALDAPPSENPKLRKLMATKAPWEP